MSTIAGRQTAGNADTDAKLLRVDSAGKGETVVFKYGPAAISISHTAPVTSSTARKPAAQGAAGAANAAGPSGASSGTVNANTPEGLAAANGFTIIGVRAVTFDGPTVAQDCMMLLKWTQFVGATTTPSPANEALPQLKFIWGNDQVYLATLNQVTINYTRFSQLGKPVRAVVDLSLHSIPNLPGPTNPSSGGLAGRRSHLLTGAETLPELATRYYGSPGHWREIAAANGVKDPLRVRPGTQVYLPSEQEAGR